MPDAAGRAAAAVISAAPERRPAASLAACGYAGRDQVRDGSRQPPGTAAGGPRAGAARRRATPTPTPTPGRGPACAAVRCTSVLVTGDMLVHAQLWEQARADALAAGAGAGLRPAAGGPAALHREERPRGLPPGNARGRARTGPFSAYPSFNVPPQIITAVRRVGYQACTTASNHTVDRGTAGLVRTLDALDAAGLRHTGSYRTRGGVARSADPADCRGQNRRHRCHLRPQRAACRAVLAGRHARSRRNDLQGAQGPGTGRGHRAGGHARRR